jgi:hypothetical protein
MAKKRNTDFSNFLRSQGLRKRVAKAVSDLEDGAGDVRGNAERLGRRVIADLRSAADEIEKRLNLGGAGARATSAKKGAGTRKRAAKKRSTAGTKGAKTGARKSTKRATSTTGRTTTGARKTSARKTTARKTTARKTTARKSSTPRKTS